MERLPPLEAMENMEKDYITGTESLVTRMEDKFIKAAVGNVPGCTSKVHDVYGDGNFLFYCLLTILELKGKEVLTGGKATTAKMIKSLRSRLVSYFNKN